MMPTYRANDMLSAIYGMGQILELHFIMLYTDLLLIVMVNAPFARCIRMIRDRQTDGRTHQTNAWCLPLDAAMQRKKKCNN